MYVRSALAVTALILFLLVPVSALSVSAADMSRPVGEINVAYGTPEADGTIGDGEYPAKVTLDSRNMKAVTAISYNVPETHSIDLFFSWDEEYLYVAVDVTDPTAAFSDVDENGNWLFNGDNTQFFADFGPTLSFRELSDTEKLGGRRSSLFASGINSDGSYFLLHQLSENDAIMNLAPNAPPAFGKVTDRGWIFEYGVLHLRQARQERMHAPPHPGGGAVRRRTGRSAAGDTLRPPKGAAVCGVHQPQKHGAASAGDQHAAKGA